MGTNLETSAVNNYSQVWDIENLFVLGASSFPYNSSSFPYNSSSNPTNTVGTLAYRATEGMIEY